MDLGLQGKVALVTASSKGLGRATAMALSQEGAKVVMCARNQDALDAAAEAMPGETLPIVADVTDPKAPGRLVDAAVDRFGALHVLVANAGGPPRARSAGQLGGGPVGDPADFGRVVCFLCSDPARFVSGTALLVDGATTRGLL
jgi:NAD(P)-dependent dehydrogenase (short-subunit alcohol dehydrogenase family)